MHCRNFQNEYDTLCLAGGTRIYVDEDVVRCCQFGVDVVVQDEVALDDNVVTLQFMLT